MAKTGSVGTIFSYSAALPATNDAAGYGALTFTEVGEVTNLGEFDKIWTMATAVALKTGKTDKRKATYDNGSLPLQLMLDPSDAGQILMAAAANSPTQVGSIQVTLPDGTIKYSQGIVLSFTTNVADASAFLMANSQVELTEDIVTV